MNSLKHKMMVLKDMSYITFMFYAIFITILLFTYAVKTAYRLYTQSISSYVKYVVLLLPTNPHPLLLTFLLITIYWKSFR